MKLKKGDSAIGFKTEDILGNKIDLKDFRGKKIFLSFYRGASCPFCNLRVHELIKHVDVFREKELVIIGVFTSERQEIMEFVGKQNPPFPIIADPEEIFYKMYGLEKSFAGKMKAMLRIGAMMKIFANGFFNMKALKDENMLPGDFLINEDGSIEVAYYGKDFGDHIDFRIINDWLNK
jgi:peroxiredoxin